MLRNYLKIAYRNLLRQKGYAFINVFGLAVGLACCLLIVLYVVDELSYDRFHEKADRIYRVTTESRLNGNESEQAQVGGPVARTLIQHFPEVETAVRIDFQKGAMVTHGGKTLRENNLAFADSTFFEVFSVPLLAGDARTALKGPYSVVLSQSAARRHFGEAEAVGKVLRFNHEQDFEVTGVYADLPANSHFHFSMIRSFRALELIPNFPNLWLSNNHFTYLVLREGADPKALEAKLPVLVEQYIAKDLNQFMGISLDQFESAGNFIRFGLQPLTDIHLSSRLDFEMEPGSDITYVYIFSAIALVILLIACINFMNLSTARSANRAKEVGVRKVVGSRRKQLIGQFLAESVLLTVLAFGISLVLVELALPYFNQLADKELSLNLLRNWYLVPLMLAVVVGVGVLAGAYPALYLSGFEPVRVLKGRLASGAKGSLVRSGLVVFQFSISIILLIGTWVITDQLHYILNKEVGFDKEQVVVLHDVAQLGKRAKVLKEEMQALPQVVNATVSGYLPAGPTKSTSTVFFTGKKSTQEGSRSMNIYFVDADYIPTMGMKIVEGRNFSEAFATDTSAVIVNEAAVRSFGWSDPVGQEVSLFGDSPTNTITLKVVGVVKDFHYESVRRKIEPLCLVMIPDPAFLSFKVNTADMAGFLAILRKKWKQVAPNQEMNYSFLDERFASTYRAERRIRSIFAGFSGLAIFIACLGLFGLTTFIAEQRTKEIGIRKVLGASVASIVGLLSKEFLRLVLIAFLVAVPVAWFVMNRWLQDFEYRVSLNWQTFALAGALALVIALVTVSFQAIKAALRDPVNSLRSE